MKNSSFKTILTILAILGAAILAITAFKYYRKNDELDYETELNHQNDEDGDEDSDEENDEDNDEDNDEGNDEDNNEGDDNHHTLNTGHDTEETLEEETINPKASATEPK